MTYKCATILMGYILNLNNNLEGESFMKKAVVITGAVVGGILTLGGIVFAVLKKKSKLKYNSDSLCELLNSKK